MILQFNEKNLKHLTCVHYLTEYQYDVPITLQSFKHNLTAVHRAGTSQLTVLFDYTALIKDCIANESRPATIIHKLINKYLSVNQPNIIQYDLRDISVDDANKLIANNIAAINELNNYFTEYVLLAQLKTL